jgi:protein involved in polysaccharide export with SLBB domain
MTNRILAANATGLVRVVLLGALLAASIAAQAQTAQTQTVQTQTAQTQTNAFTKAADDQKSVGQNTAGQNTALQAAFNDDADAYFRTIYRDFYNTYKLGPSDEIAVRVLGQPDYSLEKAQVSPVGRIYHPLVGDVDVAGLTIARVTEKLTIQLGEFIREPKVSVSLIEANSAKIGVLGDVNHPGIVLMSRPMSVLDVIASAGGVSDLGSKSDVVILRQTGNGGARTMKVNVKRIMEGKAGPEENLIIQAGDTVIVNGNFKKKLSTITSLAGFGSFVRLVSGN